MELIYIYIVLQVHLERCIPDVWYWWWLLIYRILWVSFTFWLFTGCKVKEGDHFHDWLFYQQYHFVNACSQGRRMEPKTFLRMIE